VNSGLQVIEAGANALVAGYAVFGAKDYAEGTKNIIQLGDLWFDLISLWYPVAQKDLFSGLTFMELVLWYSVVSFFKVFNGICYKLP